MKKVIGTGGILVVLAGLIIYVSLVSGRGKPIPKEQTELHDTKQAPASEADQQTPAAAQTASPDSPDQADRTQEPEGLRREGSRRFGERSFERRSEGSGFRDRGMRPPMPETSSDPNAHDEDLESVQLNDMEMKNIIQKLAEWTGKPVIPVNDEMMQTKITIYSPVKLPQKEALALLVSALHARGVMVDQTGGTVFLKPMASARLGAVPTLGIEEPLARIPDPSQIVEKWFQLSNYNASQMAEVLRSLTADYGHVTADEATGRLSLIHI